MTLIKWRPMMSPFPEDWDKWMEDAWPGGQRGFAPAMDVYETKDSVVVETPLAGVDPKDVSITVENDVLTVEGTSEHQSEVDEKNYYRKEIRSGSFHRAIALPAAVKGDAAKAEFEKGLLKITVPKAERAKANKVQINVK